MCRFEQRGVSQPEKLTVQETRQGRHAHAGGEIRGLCVALVAGMSAGEAMT
jgi:hypothetical protein